MKKTALIFSLMLLEAASGAGPGQESRRLADSSVEDLQKDLEEAGRALATRTVEAYLLRAATYYELGRYDKAREDLKQALLLKPDCREAAELLRKLETGPPPAAAAESHHRKGRELTAAGKYREAVQELDQAIRLKPAFPLAYNARGFAYLLMRNYARAIADFDEAIRLNPKYTNAYENRGVARKAIGDAKGAAKDRKQVRASGLSPG